MCNRNYEYFYIESNTKYKNNVGNFCWNACLCATYHKCRFSEINGVRIRRSHWLYCLLAALAVVTYPVWGLLYSLYFFTRHFIDLTSGVMCDADIHIVPRILLIIFLITVGGLVWLSCFLPWFLLKIYLFGIFLSIFYAPFKFAFVTETRKF